MPVDFCLAGIALLVASLSTNQGREERAPGCQLRYQLLLQNPQYVIDATEEAESVLEFWTAKKGQDAFEVVSASAFLLCDGLLNSERKTLLSGAASVRRKTLCFVHVAEIMHGIMDSDSASPFPWTCPLSGGGRL